MMSNSSLSRHCLVNLSHNDDTSSLISGELIANLYKYYIQISHSRRLVTSKQRMAPICNNQLIRLT